MENNRQAWDSCGIVVIHGMCAWVCVSLLACACVGVFVYLQECVCVCVRVCERTCVRECVGVWVCVHRHKFVYVCVGECACMCAHRAWVYVRGSALQANRKSWLWRSLGAALHASADGRYSMTTQRKRLGGKGCEISGLNTGLLVRSRATVFYGEPPRDYWIFPDFLIETHKKVQHLLSSHQEDAFTQSHRQWSHNMHVLKEACGLLAEGSYRSTGLEPCTLLIGSQTP